MRICGLTAGFSGRRRHTQRRTKMLGNEQERPYIIDEAVLVVAQSVIDFDLYLRMTIPRHDTFRPGACPVHYYSKWMHGMAQGAHRDRLSLIKNVSGQTWIASWRSTSPRTHRVVHAHYVKKERATTLSGGSLGGRPITQSTTTLREKVFF